MRIFRLKKRNYFFFPFSVIILSSVFMTELSADDLRRKINFSRPSEPGNVLFCTVETEAVSTTVLTSADGSKSEKKSTNRMSLEGIMTVKTVTDYGRPATIEFKVDKVKGEINGQDVKFASLKKTLGINLESAPCEFRIKDGKDEIGKNEILLLSLVFRKTKRETLSDFIGTDNEVMVGDSWKTPSSPLENEFAKRGIAPGDLAISGDVTIADKGELRGFNCWMFDVKLKAEKGDEFKFEFKAEVFLPDDEKTGAVKISRFSSEKVVKRITDKNNPVMPDIKEACITITDKMNLLMLPRRENKNEKK